MLALSMKPLQVATEQKLYYSEAARGGDVDGIQARKKLPRPEEVTEKGRHLPAVSIRIN